MHSSLIDMFNQGDQSVITQLQFIPIEGNGDNSNPPDHALCIPGTRAVPQQKAALDIKA